MRPIDADALNEMVDKINDTDYGSIFDYTAHREVRNVLRDIKHLIDNAPTIEAEPARHGIWTTMVHTDTGEFAGYKCSECGIVEYRNYDRCRCGAIMDGGAEE